MFKEGEVPCIFYYYIHYKMYKKYGEREISIKKAMHFLFQWRILKSLRPIIIKELELLNLVEKVNKKRIKLNRSTLDPNDVNKIYLDLGLY